ncbi:histidine--tRNA ligase [Agaribacterium sp. ZY112]|uniref:histidine--tRNA ligase n=1 Tax=Agaribacterium sp. ZY112 TaxID=3233574 RepID=UPI0035244648
MKKLQAITGMKDLLPGDSPVWQYLENTIRSVLQSYGYREIRFPILEQTELFKRGIGEATDIVEKEMYTFEDRNGDMLTLRPEGTASCVRACEQHQMLFDRGILTQKLWYTGPMFRHEKPQKGRLRQFHQFGVEAFGFKGPDVDAELLQMTASLWKKLGILDVVSLQLNSLGNAAARKAHRQALIAYFEQHVDQLDDDSKRRLHTNPLRIFDSKVDSTRSLFDKAPMLNEYLDDESKEHFDALLKLLDELGVNYTIDPLLVRGLDYYSNTVFEWVTDKLGSQGTICGGGRYDSLVEQLGGKPTSAIGFGMGVERLILMLTELNLVPEQVQQQLDVYILAVGDVKADAMKLGQELRDSVEGLRVQVHGGAGNFRAQMKKADRSGASIALVLGEDEVSRGVVAVKYLREEREQQTLTKQELFSVFN